MSAKPENPSFETIVNEALEKMRDTTAASPSYEVDRTTGQWIVRRASTTSTLFAADVVSEATAGSAGTAG